MNSPVYLDRRGDALKPAGCIEVASEIAFLRHALGDAPLLVRGQSLCNWASAFFPGRGRSCTALGSPTVELQRTCPGLSEPQAEAVRRLLGEKLTQMAPPFAIRDILTVLIPEAPWQDGPSLEHAARWLLFLAEQDPPGELQPLLKEQRKVWRTAGEADLSALYEADDSESATELLDRWLGIRRSTPPPVPREFPLPVPTHWAKRARHAWASDAIRQGISLLDELIDRSIPSCLVSSAATELAEGLLENPSTITSADISRLSPYVSSTVVQRLRESSPPQDPGEPPKELDALRDWYQRRYLPFREWQVEYAATVGAPRVQTLAYQFADWFLPFCATALNGGPGQQDFAFARSAKMLEERHGFVTLWVVLDGLHVSDARHLVSEMERCTRLSLSHWDVVLAPVPTITRVCKPALFSGRPPCDVSESNPFPNSPGAKVLRDSSNWKAELALAELGDVFIWSFPQPDKAYHAPQDPQSVLLQVRGELRTIADKLASAVSVIGPNLPVRVCVATDHGRLFSLGQRRHKAPTGMTTHGRAAWGKHDACFPASGVLLDEEAGLAYLSGVRFNLAVDCAVALDGDAFLTNDGRGGQEQFAHGGVYPEEVLIPWIEWERDAVIPEVRVRISGKAQAERSGEIRVSVENPSSLVLEVQCLRLHLRDGTIRELELDGKARPRGVTEFVCALTNWPTENQLHDAHATVRCLMPATKPKEFRAELALGVTQMYRQSLQLEDF